MRPAPKTPAAALRGHPALSSALVSTTQPRPNEEETVRAQDPRAAGHEPRELRGLAQHYLKDLVYGANDGIITTFAVVAGVAGAQLEARIVLILGFANLLADGFSMGASNFLSIRSDEAVRVSSGHAVLEPFPARHSLATFAAFIVAGVVPLLSYVMALGDYSFAVAVGMTLATLFIVGAARSFVTDVRWWRGGLEMLTVGSIAAAVAYGVGAFVDGVVSA
jgi:VIT1/CCC1 family predicted Fe2+/Mn2+ transporter